MYNPIIGNDEPTEFKFDEFIEKTTGEKGYNMVILIANRFMKGVYISVEEVKKAHKGFNNTLHDLNHMGSGYQVGFFTTVPSDISYIVGWQDGVSFDKKTNEVRANVHIEKTAPRYNDWESYINICAKIGRIPNVSMFAYGQIEYIEARKLPKNSHYRQAGFNADDLVPCMVNIIPFMVSTVTKGVCDDKLGCGIKHSDNECSDGICDLDKKPSKEVDILEADAKMIKERKERIEKRLKEFKKR